MQPPRETSATRRFSEFGGSCVKRESFGSKPGRPQRWRSTGSPFEPASVPTSTIVWPATQLGAARALNEKGTCCRFGGRAGPVTVSSVPKTCRFETAATEIAAGALLGRADRAEAEVVAVVAGRDDRHHAGGGDVVERVDQRVGGWVDLGPAAGEVDHVHAVVHGCLEGEHDLGREGVEPAGRDGHVEDAVVAEPRARAIPERPLTCGWSGPAVAIVPATPAAIPATCVPWNESAR